MICDECKRTNGHTCCEVLIGEVPIMPLSVRDVHRIAAVTGLRAEEFTVVEDVDLSEMTALISLSPMTRSLFAGNTIVRLKTVPSVTDSSVDQCLFLGEKGCTLDGAVRPRGCRLFPFAYDSRAQSIDRRDGLVRLPTGSGCLATAREPSDDTRLAESLGMTRAELLEIGEIHESDAKSHYDPRARE